MYHPGTHVMMCNLSSCSSWIHDGINPIAPQEIPRWDLFFFCDTFHMWTDFASSAEHLWMALDIIMKVTATQNALHHVFLKETLHWATAGFMMREKARCFYWNWGWSLICLDLIFWISSSGSISLLLFFFFFFAAWINKQWARVDSCPVSSHGLSGDRTTSAAGTGEECSKFHLFHSTK